MAQRALGAARRRVAFLTDVEGNLGFLRRSADFSSVVRLDGDGALAFRDAHGLFVFGGDAVDQGPGDLAVARALVRFKRAHPDRVFLLAGNRDINKMWLPSMLWPLWDTDRARAAERLKHILANRMGAPRAFEQRRVELAEAGQPSSDEAVTQTFVAGLREGGYMRDYLAAAQLAVRLGDCLFVHGALPATGVGFVPGAADPAADVDAWLAGLGRFYRREFEAWTRNPTGASDPAAQGGRQLMEYGRPRGMGGRAVVYNDWLEREDTLPEGVPEPVAAFLHRSGVRRVFTGHRPHGDSPTPIRGPYGTLVVTADTSYSDKNSEDNRGDVVYEVLAELDPPKRTILRGVRGDGAEYDFAVEDDDRVGTPWSCPDGKRGWVKGAVSGSSAAADLLVCFSRGPGTFSSELDYEQVSSPSPAE